MPSTSINRRQQVQRALSLFVDTPIDEAASQLLNALGYASEKTDDLGRDPEIFLSNIETNRADLGSINRKRIKAENWQSCAFLFQLTNDEIPMLASGHIPFNTDKKVVQGQIESLVFLAIDLKGEQWTRTELASISRELNKYFPMPAIIVFRHGQLMSLAVIDRREHKREVSRDVIDSRITVIKDVRYAQPHRAHINILTDLALENLGERRRPTNFRELYDAWIEALSTLALNKRFYIDLAQWYFWAVKQVDFPKGGGIDSAKRNSVSIIRLLTRLIFVWFIKEKGLLPDLLFERDHLKKLLKIDPATHPEDGNYYLAILQNLFFATLNVKMGEKRKWTQQGAGMKGDRLVHSLYRYKELFITPDAALEIFSKIPFINGGLFECLDRELTVRDLQNNPKLKDLATKEGNGEVLRIDGFSRRKDAQPFVPNKIFFGGEADADLNADLGTRGKRVDVQGLLDIFSHYKFTVNENTPIEEEVALDPELLGKVFENLLASYNEDTQTTARKQSGSFYTPREVVDYMVDETLIAYFERHLADTSEHEERLRSLLSYATDDNPFNDDDTACLIAAIERLKILDPACGSGAFPMGVLNKLVQVLRKLDPGNQLWKAQNRAPLEALLTTAKTIPDLSLRDSRVEEAKSALDNFDRNFADGHHADYTRKLYLIEKCIHGVDIQPIAVQIAKLRFFISLIVSQEINAEKPNSGITPLPNLETKIIAANSLIPIERPAQRVLRNPTIDQKERELVEANEGYFTARTAKTKRSQRERIFELRDELARLLEQDDFLAQGAARNLVQWNPFDQNASASFFDPEWMFQLAKGFDITIGNPPYVRHEEIKHFKNNLKLYYNCFIGTADLYVYFYERSINLLKPEGAFSFITSNKWYRAKYGEKLREWMNQNTHLRVIIDFGDEPVFTALAYPTIIVATRRKQTLKQPASSDQVRVLNWVGQGPVEYFSTVFATENFMVPQSELKREGWQLEPPIKRRLLERIRASGVPLSEYVGNRLYRGILTGFNDAFVINSTTREQLIAEDPKSGEIIKPFLRGRDVKRWRVESRDLWLIFTRRGIAIKQYPAILNYLQAFKEQLMPKPGSWNDERDGRWLGRKAGSYEWYEIQDNIAYWQEFEKIKIFVPAIEDGVEYAPDVQGYYGNDKTNIIVTDDWRYVLSVLNSSVSWWLTQQTFSSKQGGFYEFKPMYVSQVPIPSATPQQKQLMNGAINGVLGLTLPNLELLINGLVYELFFPKELHAANIRLFDACKQAGLGKLASLEGEALVAATQKLVATIFAPSHPIYAMLFNLQALDVVRIIEDKA